MDKEKRRLWINDYRNKSRQKLKRFVDEYKKNSGCKTCGYNKCASALIFHHHQYNKEAKISRLVGSGAGLERVKKEIEKCNVMCSNCHLEFHYATGE